MQPLILVNSSVLVTVSVQLGDTSNHVTVDGADSIDVSGDWNTVTYHSGSPRITNTTDNTVQQG
jgi:hypothetical protein